MKIDFKKEIEKRKKLKEQESFLDHDEFSRNSNPINSPEVEQIIKNSLETIFPILDECIPEFDSLDTSISSSIAGSIIGLRNRIKSNISIDVKLKNKVFEHDFYYMDEKIYSYSVKEDNIEKHKIDETIKLKFKSSEITIQTNIDPEISNSIELASTKDTLLKEAITDALTKLYILFNI